jgi:hypothetical protein
VSDDWRVTGRSDEEVRTIAERTKAELGVSRRRPVNILRCLESGSVPTVYGRKKLIFRVVNDADLGKHDAKTEFTDGVVTITVKRSVRDHAEIGDGRARMTLAHELAHAVMHHTQTKYRGAGASGPTALARSKGYESAEHQAKVFAATFLIHEEDAAAMQSAEEISVEFGVSKQAADIFYDRLLKRRERARASERVRKMADEAKAALVGQRAPAPITQRPPAPATKYLPDPCTACGNETLILLGPKVHCETCGFSGDQLQDGDKSNEPRS